MTATLTDLQIPAESTQYVRVPVAEVTGADPTADTVYMAFPITGHSDPGPFYTASWMTLNGIYYIRCLIGPGGVVQLAEGYFDVFVKISDNPETPVLFSGTLEVY